MKALSNLPSSTCLVMLAVLCSLVFLATGCEEVTGPDPPPPPPPPDCEVYDTATVVFMNESRYSTYSVVWDGSSLGSIGPAQSLRREGLAAGPHTLAFKFANTGRLACNQASPVLVACETRCFSCSNDY
jgi:hypothetical protein